jgi:hypothetical protein
MQVKLFVEGSNLQRYGRSNNKSNHVSLHLTPKELRVFLLKTASRQPLLKASWIVQNWNQFWYFQP